LSVRSRPGRRTNEWLPHALCAALWCTDPIWKHLPGAGRAREAALPNARRQIHRQAADPRSIHAGRDRPETQMAPPAAGTERPDEQVGREIVTELRGELRCGLLMAKTSKTARLETSTGSVSHDTVGQGKIPRAVAQGEQERAAFLDSVPPLSRGLIAGAVAGTASPRQAVKAFCLA